MEYFIQQNATLPILKVDVVRDGRTESWKEFYSILDNAILRFSMTCEDDGIQKIFMKDAYLVQKEKMNVDSETEYYIYYKWDSVDTNKKGRFVGQFSIVLEEGQLIVPIRENLYINIV